MANDLNYGPQKPYDELAEIIKFLEDYEEENNKKGAKNGVKLKKFKNTVEKRKSFINKAKKLSPIIHLIKKSESKAKHKAVKKLNESVDEDLEIKTDELTENSRGLGKRVLRSQSTNNQKDDVLENYRILRSTKKAKTNNDLSSADDSLDANESGDGEIISDNSDSNLTTTLEEPEKEADVKVEDDDDPEKLVINLEVANNETEVNDMDVTNSSEDAVESSFEEIMEIDQTEIELKEEKSDDSSFEQNNTLIESDVLPIKQKEVTAMEVDSIPIDTSDVAKAELYKCSECNLSYQSFSKLASHSKLKHATLMFEHKCKSCDFGTNAKAKFEGHLKTHRTQSFECDQCQKKLTSKIAYNKHMKTHTAKPFVCEICNKGFPKEVALKTHKGRMHKVVKPDDSIISEVPMESLIKENEVSLEASIQQDAQKDTLIKLELPIETQTKQVEPIKQEVQIEASIKQEVQLKAPIKNENPLEVSIKQEVSIETEVVPEIEKPALILRRCHICKNWTKGECVNKDCNAPQLTETTVPLLNNGLVSLPFTETNNRVLPDESSEEILQSDEIVMQEEEELLDEAENSQSNILNNVSDEPEAFEDSTLPNMQVNSALPKQQEKVYICPFCEKKYLTPKGLKKHLEIHMEGNNGASTAQGKPKNHHCTKKGCKQSFSTLMLMKKHLKTHKIDESIVCPLCNIDFKNVKLFKKHQMKDHSNAIID